MQKRALLQHAHLCGIIVPVFHLRRGEPQRSAAAVAAGAAENAAEEAEAAAGAAEDAAENAAEEAEAAAGAAEDAAEEAEAAAGAAG